ncbi:MAG: hypothetical protein HY039_08770 [Nitrospirae bacterium]|nr:hypothetical protein [Nitrospirota bacterium]
MRPRICALSMMFVAIVGTDALGAEDWTLSLTPAFSYGRYQGSPTRESVTGGRLFLDAQYFERAGLTVGGDYANVNGKPGYPDIAQYASFLSGRASYVPDAVPARIGLRMDLHAVDNNDATNGTDQVRVLASRLSVSDLGGTVRMDVGYASSRFGRSATQPGNLEVRQWTPTAGFGLNGEQWLQLRGYFIISSNPVRSQGRDGTSALEVKWTYRPERKSDALLENVQLAFLLGERIYAVDGDSAAVYNLADLQTGAIALSTGWRVGRSTSILLGAGWEKYKTALARENVSYTSLYGFLALAGEW